MALRRFDLPRWTLTISMTWIAAAGAFGAADNPSSHRDCLVNGPRDTAGTAFIDVTVIPMDRERLLQKQTVLVRSCRIEAIGSRDELEVPDDYRRILGGEDVYLLPGLVDAHTHLRYDADLTLYLSRGVTTVRNMEERGPEHLRWRGEVQSGEFGPRILTAGPTSYASADTRAEVVDAVHSMAASGYDFVKVFDPLPEETYEWLIDAASDEGLPIAGHIPREVGARTVLGKSSHRTIEHAEQFVYHWFYDDLDRTRIPELVEQVRRSGAAVTPTMEVIHSWIAVVNSLDSLLSRPEVRWLHPETLAYWHTRERSSSFENRLIADFQKDIVRELARQEVPLLTGTDTYMVGILGPWGLRREMRRMLEAGLSPFEVLKSATATPGAVLGYDAGTVAVDRLADLFLVRGNPLLDLTALEQIEGVMLDGIWHPAEELEERLEVVEAAYRPGLAFVAEALGGQIDRALAEHRAARAAGDDHRTDVGVVTYVASILRRKGRLEEALALYSLVLEESPERASAYEGMGRTLLALGRIQEAVERLERALEIDPDRESTRALLAELRQMASP